MRWNTFKLNRQSLPLIIEISVVGNHPPITSKRHQVQVIEEHDCIRIQIRRLDLLGKVEISSEWIESPKG